MNRGSSMNERVIVIRYEYDCFEDRCFDISIRIFLRISRYIKLESSSVDKSLYTQLSISKFVAFNYISICERDLSNKAIRFFFLFAFFSDSCSIFDDR